MITEATRQKSFEDIQDKAKIRYIQILNRLDKPKTAKELAVELFELEYIPSTERNYTAPRLTELEKMGYVKAIDKKKCQWTGKMVAIYALTAQIGNSEYKDFKGRTLKENEYYCLVHKNFYPVDFSDGIKTIKVLEKRIKGITIIKGLSFNDYETEVYVVKENELCAHGKTLKEALEDLQFKKTKSKETQKIVDEIKEKGKVTRSQYRAITGACQYGTNKFCEEHNIQDLEEIELEKLRKILINDYGAEKFWSLIDGK